MSTRLGTNYTVTYSAGNLVVTYASVYATQTISVASLILTAIDATYFVIGDNYNNLTTLNFSKCTAPSAASVALVLVAINALLPTAPTLAASNVFTGTTNTFAAIACTSITPTAIVQTTTNKTGRSISTDTTLTANTDMGKTIIGVIGSANLLVTLMNSTGQFGFITIAVGAGSNLANDLRVIPGGGEWIFGLGLNDALDANKYFTLLAPAVGDYIKLQSDAGGQWLVVDACGAWTREA